MKKKIAVFGGSFNPPGEHHRAVAQAVAPHVDEVYVLPCGPRPDKPTTNDVEPIYRAAMVDMAFRGVPKTVVDLFDLENDTFTRTFDIDEKLGREAEPWHIVGTDLITGGARNESPIHKGWKRGEELWKRGRFLVVKRPGVPFDEKDLPPTRIVVDAPRQGSSSDIRNAIYNGKPYGHLVPAEIARYIERYGLYRGRPSDRSASLTLDAIRPIVVIDEQNPEAAVLAKQLGFPANEKNPNLVLVIGGDGAMLHAIRKYWRHRLPFYGLNVGHLGFLLNDKSSPPSINKALSIYLLPLLWVEAETVTGKRLSALAFNDAWVERASGQAAWIRIAINGKERMPMLVGDNALVATAAGSASYARAMGAHPLPCNTPALLLVASNVLRPSGWRGAVMPLNTVVELSAIDPVKRPLAGFMDGEPLGNLSHMKVRVSKTASVELAFAPEFDPAEKLGRIQFPALSD